MSRTGEILNTFENISLEEMDSVKLMDRSDTKYTFRGDQLPLILEEMRPHYRSLEISGKRMSSYETLYFDSMDLSLYNKHQQGKLNRYKVRKRNYSDTGAAYLEVKFKNNKGRTIKQRIKVKGDYSDFEKSSKEFLSAQLPFDPSILMETVWVFYKRITLVNKKSAERVTIDTELAFQKENKRFEMSNLVIAEVKQDKKVDSPFVNCMRKHHIRQGSISKYCMAVAATHPDVKTNNFKEKFHIIKKITEHDIIANSR